MKILLADEYGAGGGIEILNPIGKSPVVSRCTTYQIDDPVNQPMESLTAYLDDGVVKGLQTVSGSKVGSFGRVDLRDVKVFRFSKEKPLVGLWGFNTSDSISALGVIQYDTTSECYKDLQRAAGIAVEDEDDDDEAENNMVE